MNLQLAARYFSIASIGLVCFGMTRHAPVVGSNDSSRWDTVWSLTHGKGYVIDDAPYFTLDKIRRDQHFYSSKPPLMPTCVAGLASVIEAGTGARLPNNQRVLIPAILFVISALPLGVSILLYGKWMEELGMEFAPGVFCLSAASFGTLVTSFSTVLSNHNIAAYCVFFSLYSLMKIRGQGRCDHSYFAICGFFTAWAMATELPSVAMGLIIAGILFRFHRAQALRYFVPPLLFVVSAHLFVSYFAVGGFVPNYIRFHSPLYEYPGSYWSDPKGIDAIHEAKWLYLFHYTLGHHGLFSLMPIVLIAFFAPFVDPRLRLIHVTGVCLFAVTLGLYVLTTSNYGGASQGPRLLLWMTPFWLFGLACVVKQYYGEPLFRRFAYITLAVSIWSTAFGFVGHRGPWDRSWIHQVERASGLVEY